LKRTTEAARFGGVAPRIDAFLRSVSVPNIAPMSLLDIDPAGQYSV
jgi:hypothetical protein